MACRIIRRSIHIEAKIAKLGYSLPAAPAAPKGSYMNYVRNGNTIYLSGHLPIPADGGPMVVGRLGENMDVAAGQAAARLSGLQLLASIRAACGDLDKVKRVLKLTGFVNSTADFTSQPAVMNGCSDFFGEVFGFDIGRHARSAVGVNVLPLGAAVEIEAIVEVEA